MSRRSNRARRRSKPEAAGNSAASALSGPAAANAVQMPFGRSGFDGANFSTRRGYIYFPTLDTRREVDSLSRLELIRRSRWLRRNTGYAKRCVNGLANMVGYLTPQALTTDRRWNQLAEQAWKDRACSAATFDLSGRFNVNNYQPFLTRSKLGDGDVLSVFTIKHGCAAVMTYEAHQVAAGRRLVDVDGWRDGVRTTPHGEPTHFSVVADPTTGETVDIPAESCAFSCDYESFGWRRGVTALHHAVNNLLDVTEIQSDLKLGIKTSTRIGYYISTPTGQQATVPGMADAIRQNLQAARAPKGGNVLLEDTFRGGRIPEMLAGQEIKQLLDERPHPNSMAFIEHINRDIAAGLEMSSDVLWNIAKLGGASVRYVLADAQTTIDRLQQALVDQFLFRFWVYFIAVEMESGRLPRCTDPRWWAVGFLPPAQITVDVSRDGKLAIELHRAGLLTAKRWYGTQGLDVEEEDRQRVEEYARRIALCAEIQARYASEGISLVIDPEKVFPTGIPGAAAPRPDNAPNAGDHDAEPTGRFSDPEHFQYIESRLDEIESRLGIAA